MRRGLSLYSGFCREPGGRPRGEQYDLLRSFLSVHLRHSGSAVHRMKSSLNGKEQADGLMVTHHSSKDNRNKNNDADNLACM